MWPELDRPLIFGTRMVLPVTHDVFLCPPATCVAQLPPLVERFELVAGRLPVAALMGACAFFCSRAAVSASNLRFEPDKMKRYDYDWGAAYPLRPCVPVGISVVEPALVATTLEGPCEPQRNQTGIKRFCGDFVK